MNHMKQITFVLIICGAVACNNRFENEGIVKSDQVVKPEDTSITSYPPGNIAVPPNVQPYTDSTKADTAALDSTKRKNR
ncbi:MAG: hypothetical protein A1D16_07090 [Flavihumibacter sp. CACIAM 22H1]|nr:MAG: hypothetical protein A1D16_07090 [Flavihumibacter sp. CACIAM 22H1]